MGVSKERLVKMEREKQSIDLVEGHRDECYQEMSYLVNFWREIGMEPNSPTPGSPMGIDMSLIMSTHDSNPRRTCLNLCLQWLQKLPTLAAPLKSSPSPSTSISVSFQWSVTEPVQSIRVASSASFRPKAATLTADSPADVVGAPPKVLLEVKGLKAVVKESKQEILRGVDLTLNEGEVHAIMGKNGSGKSTFSKVLVGHPDYEVTGGSVFFKGENLLDMEPENRSHAGLFMSFHTPVEIPGVRNDEFILMAYNARRKKQGLPPLEPLQFYNPLVSKVAALNMNPTFVNRAVNEGFSGGEKKRNEILQLAVLEADLAILDEMDSGLDVDALEDVAKAVYKLLTPKNSVLMITHYQRLMDYILPG